MTVVIGFDKDGKRRYGSSTGLLRFSTAEELARADALDELIKKRIDKFVTKSKLKEKKKDRVGLYWELGQVIRDIFFNSNLVSKEEKAEFFKNVRLHLDNEIFPADDVSRSRNIPEQFFRLAGYPKDAAEKAKWTTWSYLFDSPILSRVGKFDTWFSKNLNKSKIQFDQSFSRLWFQSIGALFKNVVTDDWDADQLLHHIECLFEICSKLVALGYKPGDKKTLETLRRVISEHRKQFILFKLGQLSKSDYIEIIVTNFEQKVKI